MFATQVLPEALSDDSVEGSNPEIVGLLIVDEKKYELKKGETKIGRDSSMCSIVLENFTVSKVHAVIESEGFDDTFIYDVGSTNQTKLGKKILKPHCRYKLDNDSKLTLGNVIAKFIIPPDKSSGYNSQTDKLGDIDMLNELGDIFDIPTQVNIVQPNTSSNKIEKSPENFKIPYSVSPAETSRALNSCFDEDTECRLDSQQRKPKAYYGSALDNSAIFSLSTQCQLYESQVEQERKCMVQTVGGDESNKNSDSDKVKSLLNDGQDDVLCCFMSLHSPNEQTNSESGKEIKVKTEFENLSQVLDASTQVEIIQESIGARERDRMSDKELIKDFPTGSKPTITSTPLSNKFLCPKNVTENKELQNEDLLETQEFNQSESGKNTKGGESADLSQDSETQPYLGETLNEIDTSEPKNDDEDLILTQTFENSRENKKVVPETQEPEGEDFLETQIFSLERDVEREGRILQQSPDQDFDTTLNFTQRNDDDDFIATQVFEESTRKPNRSSDSNDNDDEDFIATQKLEFPRNEVSPRKDCQGASAASRESSPDLLAPESFSKNSEDGISTQIFEPPICQTTAQQISSHCSIKNDCTRIPDPPVESSGDETESDLEIIMDETIKKEPGAFIKSEQPECIQRIAEHDDSNSSYVFELEAENRSQQAVPGNTDVNKLSDSDATDCEEIAMMNVQVKEEPKQKMEFEETQVLTLTLPDNFAEKTSGPNDDWMAGRESPRFGVESPLSLEMPNTQDIQTTVDRILGSGKPENEGSSVRTEVGMTNEKNRIEHSPLKRPLDCCNGEVAPVKKFKTTDRSVRNSERLFSKLVQAHDIAQIQPSRTRNSLKNLSSENKTGVRPLGGNVNNERPTSRRKANGKRGSTRNPNGDITPYLTKKEERKSCTVRKKETFRKENQPVGCSTRVLRSSTRNAAAAISPPNRSVSTRATRRNSRTKSGDYFGGGCVNVVFTGFTDCGVLEKIISDLGGKRTNELSSGEVVVADKVRRTVKFLSAVGLGLPIASPEWLMACKKAGKFLNPWDFILKDEESEERWNFELKSSLEKSKKVKLLEGFSVFATQNTKPPVKDLLAIVEFCGGTPLFDFPDIWPRKTIFVSCLEDKKWWPLAKLRNVKIVHYEFILSGVLTQKIDFKTYKLR